MTQISLSKIEAELISRIKVREYLSKIGSKRSAMRDKAVAAELASIIGWIRKECYE